jgi:D-alanyl-D-alanine carboxypeptidase
MDGIKTGFTRASGYNLVASVKRGDRRLIGVVMGSPSAGGRNQTMARILDEAFSTPAPKSAAKSSRMPNRRTSGVPRQTNAGSQTDKKRS